MKSALTTSYGTSYGYSRKHRVLEVVCIAAVLGLLLAFCLQVPRTVHSPGGWVNLVLTGLTAYVASDVLTGIAHWSGDTLGDEQLWFFGPNFIRPFREHHVDQKAITRHDFIETNGNNCIGMCGPLALAFILLPHAESFGFFAWTFLAFVSLFMVATNQLHKWAHIDRPPALVRWLQRWGLILSPGHHDVHHTRPHDRHYCITVGWMNPVLNRLHFFRAAEWLIARTSPSWLHLEDRDRHAASMKAASLNIATSQLPASAAVASPAAGPFGGNFRE
ncbi:MAG: fatty acid desaturase family protein [Myxococcales bacterium]